MNVIEESVGFGVLVVIGSCVVIIIVLGFR